MKFIYLKSRLADRRVKEKDQVKDKERNFLFTISLLKWSKLPELTQDKARNQKLSSPTTQALEPSFAPFPRHTRKKEAISAVEQLSLKLAFRHEPSGITSSSLTYCDTTLAPS